MSGTGAILRRAGGFTLLEMLVVLTVIAMVAGLTAGVAGAIRGSRGSTAVQEMAALLDDARAQALTGQGEVVVAFATEAVEEAGLAYRAVMMCRERPGVAGSERVYEAVSGWHRLPEGYVFAEADPASNEAGVNVLSAADARQRVRLPGGGGGEARLPCIGFRELGEVTRPRETRGRPVLVAVAEGQAEAGGPVNLQGGEHTAEQCRWLAVQRNSGNNMILP